MSAPRRTPPTSRHARWALLALLALTAACAGDDARPPPCPEVLRVGEAAKLVKFAGAGRDLTDVRFEASIEGVSLTCEYDDDAVEAALQIAMLARRGPADRDRMAPLSYFVAIADRQDRILARETFDLAVPFEGNQTALSVLDEVSPRIPLAGNQNGADFVIYVGFVLSRQELDFNRGQR